MKKVLIGCTFIFICCTSYSMVRRTRRPSPSLQQPETLHTAHQVKKFIARYNAYKQFEHSISREISIAEETDTPLHEQQPHNYTLLRLKKLKKYIEQTENKQLLNFFNPPHKSSPALIGSLLQNLLTERENKREFSTLQKTFDTIDSAALQELQKLKKEMLTDAITLEFSDLIMQRLQDIFNSYAPMDLVTEQSSALLSRSMDSLVNL